jgi:hypothetical protein
MKLRLIWCLLLQLCWLLPTHVKAQEFSGWSVDPKLKTLKVRYMQFKATDGYEYIRLEVSSSISCSMQITSTVCNADTKETNGWKQLKFTGHETKTVYFKVHNSCTNGWWWWYRNYKDLRATY